MCPEHYIAHLPLKYFKGLTLDLFPGKRLRGRVISTNGERVRIELGGAILEACSKRNLKKGDTVTLKVKTIGPQGISLEIIDTPQAR